MTIVEQLAYRIEHIAKFKKKQAKILQTAKKEAADSAKRVVEVLPRRTLNEDASWKREILEGRKRRQSSERAAKVETGLDHNGCFDERNEQHPSQAE